MSVEFKLPDLGEGIHEAEILAVKVNPGQFVKEDETIFEVETDKAVVEIPSPVAGIVEAVHVREGQVVTVGSIMISFKIDASTNNINMHKEEVASPQMSSQKRVDEKRISTGPIPATPAIRRLARELGIDLSLVQASGMGGRIQEQDLRSFAAHSTNTSSLNNYIETQPGEKIEDEVKPPSLPTFELFGAVERLPLRSVRKRIAHNMTVSWTYIPHVTQGDEADITQLDALLVKHEGMVQSAGTKPSLTAFVMKVVAHALQKYPQFNASLDLERQELIYKRFYNLGVAVATDRGLIVPVIRNVDQKSIMEVSTELSELVKKTRAAKVELENLQGATFTVTNIGAIGGTMMTPMINYPEAAILGLGRAIQKPVVKNGAIEIGLVLPLALSFDHRIADGAEAAHFLQTIVKGLEQPFTLILEVS